MAYGTLTFDKVWNSIIPKTFWPSCNLRRWNLSLCSGVSLARSLDSSLSCLCSALTRRWLSADLWDSSLSSVSLLGTFVYPTLMTSWPNRLKSLLSLLGGFVSLMWSCSESSLFTFFPRFSVFSLCKSISSFLKTKFLLCRRFRRSLGSFSFASRHLLTEELPFLHVQEIVKLK